MSIAVNKIASRLKKDLGYYSIEFDLETDCKDLISLFDKRIQPLKISLENGKYNISGSKSESNRYAVIYYRHADAYPHLLLRIPTSEPLFDQIQLNSIVFKLSDVYTLEKLYNMTNTGVKDYAQRARKAVKRAFRMKSSPVEHKRINTTTASKMRKYFKIQPTPQKKSPDVAITPKKRYRTASLPARVPTKPVQQVKSAPRYRPVAAIPTISPKKRPESLPVHAPSKPAKRGQVKSARRFHRIRAEKARASLGAPPRKVTPPEVPLAEAQPKAPLAEAPLAEAPPAEAPLAEAPLEIPLVQPEILPEVPPDKGTTPAERRRSRSNQTVEALVPAPEPPVKSKSPSKPPMTNNVPIYPGKLAKPKSSLRLVPEKENRTNLIHSDPKFYKQKEFAGRRIVHKKIESKANNPSPVAELPPTVVSTSPSVTGSPPTVVSTNPSTRESPPTVVSANPSATESHPTKGSNQAENLIEVYKKRLNDDILKHIQTQAPEEIRDKLLTKFNEKRIYVNHFAAEFIKALSQHTKNIHSVDRHVIDNFYHVWFTCFFKFEYFFLMLLRDRVENSKGNLTCSLKDTYSHTDAITVGHSERLRSELVNTLRNRIKAYIRQNTEHEKLKNIIMNDQIFLYNNVNYFLSTTLAQPMSIDRVYSLFKTWYNCYFNISDYFKNVCKNDKHLLNHILTTLRDPRECDLLNIKKRRHSFISERRHKAERLRNKYSFSNRRPPIRDVLKYTSDVNFTLDIKQKLNTKRELRAIQGNPQWEHMRSIIIPKLTSKGSIEKFYNRKYINDHAMCLALIAHVKSLRQKPIFPIPGILRIWYHYVELTTKLLVKYKKAPDHIKVLKLWKMLKHELTIYTKSDEENKFFKSTGIDFQSNAGNFLYDLHYNGALNCAGGTSMLYALIKNDGERRVNKIKSDKHVKGDVNPEDSKESDDSDFKHEQDFKKKHGIIDIRTVNARKHTLIAIGDTWLLDTTRERSLYTLQEYETIRKCSVYVHTEYKPIGLLNECVKLMEASDLKSMLHVDVLYEMLLKFGIANHTDSDQIKLFVQLCELGTARALTQYADILKNCISQVRSIMQWNEYDHSYERPCLQYVTVQQEIKIYYTIDALWKKLKSKFENDVIKWNDGQNLINDVFMMALNAIKKHNETFHKSKKEVDLTYLLCYNPDLIHLQEQHQA